MGIYVGGTTSSNHLDDYEEGGFTWTMDDLTNSPTIWNNVGTYEKYGRLVHVQGHIQIGGTKPTFSTLSGTFKVSGLPFAHTNGVGYSSALGHVRWSQLNWVGPSQSSYGHNDDTQITAGIQNQTKIVFSTCGQGIYYVGDILKRAVHDNYSWNLEWDIWYRVAS